MDWWEAGKHMLFEVLLSIYLTYIMQNADRNTHQYMVYRFG